MAGLLFWVLLRLGAFQMRYLALALLLLYWAYILLLGSFLILGLTLDQPVRFGKKEYTGKIGFILQAKCQNFFASKKVYFC